MGIKTYNYPPQAYPMTPKYTNKGQCAHCGHKWINEANGYACEKCKIKVHGGIEVDGNVYFHGKQDITDVKGYIPIFKYPPKKYPIKAIYCKSGCCVHCKNTVEINSFKCAKCGIYFHCGVKYGRNVYFHGKRKDNVSEPLSTLSHNKNNRYSSASLYTEHSFDNMLLESDSETQSNVTQRLKLFRRYIYVLLISLIVILALIIIFIVTFKSIH